MAVIARDPNAPYTKLSDVMRIGKNRGCSLEDILHDTPDYVQYLVERSIIEIGGEVEEEYNRILGNKTTYDEEAAWHADFWDGPEVADDSDTRHCGEDHKWDHPDDDSIADFKM